MWIDRYLEYVDGTEPPYLYHKWTAISCVAAALGKKVWMEMGPIRLWPNLYITLVGPSGARKSTAMSYGQSLLSRARIATAPDSLSGWQAFVKTMESQGKGIKLPELGGTIIHHTLTVFAKELKVFIKEDLNFVAMLTDLYDCTDRWEYYTVKREVQSLSWAYLNILAATAPDWIRTMLPPESIGGGYTARNIYVWAEKKGRADPAPVLREGLGKELVRELGVLSGVRGAVGFSPAAQEAYTSWYLASELEPPSIAANPRFEGYVSRRAIFIRKLAIVRCMARRGEEIEVEDLDWARLSLEEAERGMTNVFAGQGSSPLADITYRVTKAILEDGRITTGELLRRFMYDLDPFALRSIEDNLRQQGVITVEMSADGEEKVYTKRV